MTAILFRPQYVQIQGVRLALWYEVEAKVRMHQSHVNFVAIYMNKKDKTVFYMYYVVPDAMTFTIIESVSTIIHFRTFTSYIVTRLNVRDMFYDHWNRIGHVAMTVITDTTILKPILQSKHCNSFDDSHP